MYQSKSILIEMNTIPTAIHVYNSIMNSQESSAYPEKVFFLSSQTIPNHRGPRIEQIKHRLERSETIVLVSTQVIEAGVDLDFNVAIRYIGPIDSIIQAAGRCNRNGKRKATESPFYVYKVVNEKGHEFARDIYKPVSIEIANSLINENNNDLINIVQSYYKEIRKRRSCKESYEINKAIPNLNYEGVDEAFELIDQFKIPVFVEFDLNAINIWKRFESLLSKELKKPTRSEVIQIRHEMEQYMIAITQKHAETTSLEEKSRIYRIAHDDIDRLYNETTGFMPP